MLAGFFGLTATLLGPMAPTGWRRPVSRLSAWRRSAPPCSISFPRPGLMVLGLCGVRGKVITFAGTAFCWGSWDSPAVFTPWCCSAAGAGVHHPGRWPLFYVGMGGSDMGRLSSWRKNDIICCFIAARVLRKRRRQRSPSVPATCSATVSPGSKDDSGYVLFELYDEEQADLLARKLPFRGSSSSARCWW